MEIEMFKDVLREARTKLGLKQNEVAELIGVTPQTYLKWENGKSEPKISQAGKLAKVLKISEKELCQGEFHKQKMEPLAFIRKVEVLLRHVPHAEFLIGIQEYIDDEEGFIEMLKNASNHPYELFDIEEVHHAEWVLEMVEKGEFTFNDEKYKAKFIEAQKKIIKEKSEKAGLIKKP
ncbi:Cro/Cl family transcriptional regulator [Vibrio cholerae]|uniref:Cro/Cl family transcriptional regulator n=1 Tax=Vibrio cholerae TaxID=666 RepID=A0A395TCN0_VIBCL|nr:helix-turn-helix domain-containing protein [Vibrio cholerae]MCX9560802.1 helix-turn-helix domain-containing protein [Vibrio cholerae]MCX9564639.1 helix-turn-helix domain-containing protein [Vibrio cholerae]RGP82423.1 Cro/Cl family transcriptional regulator [Vibrio cholerae]RGP82427.1 Cro/Cl family transcriptional regulator [Vibrio cholerae]RGP82469.1 Cro/Cl family transcriptional regulator [Vibrio cholerae]